jgi:ADP-ribosylglycohydrolase
MSLPPDYVERVYAGVLGKIIGVYLGRPFEGWTYDQIMAQLGEIWYYVHGKRGLPLIVTDDDISGTFTFLRALPDYGNSPALTPAQIGQTWMNYLIENRVILWWGGLGNSTEHTAYLRLKNGMPAPHSGSIAANGKVVAEQIGAQIFIDGWAMVSPGDPARAADLARRAASVSHDGEAIYGAQVMAAMEALAFIEPDTERLIETAITLIPRDSIIYRLIGDLREWHARYPDWHDARLKIVEHYGYDKYGGNCHMVPNHALIHLGLLYGEDNFQKALMITNTSGWDTDCNSANIGCLMGIKLGLQGIDQSASTGADFRGPVADRLYLPTADGGRAVTDAVTETYAIANIGRALAGEPPLAPKAGARFHFSLPGSVQGFSAEDPGVLSIENVKTGDGARGLALHYQGVTGARPARLAAATFITPEAAKIGGYGLLASPALYPGQTVRAAVIAGQGEVRCGLFLRHYGEGDRPVLLRGPQAALVPGQQHEFTWRIPDLMGDPVYEIGLELTSERGAPKERRPPKERRALKQGESSGTAILDYLTWDGEAEVTFTRPAHQGNFWRQAWVNGVDHFESGAEPFRLIQDSGSGLLLTGAREWRDYSVSAALTPHMVKSCGLAARVQGMRRFYALMLDVDGWVRLVKALDGNTTLAEALCTLEFGRAYELSLTVRGDQIQAFLDGRLLFEVTDRDLATGGIALVCEEGRVAADAVHVKPAL